MSELIATHLDGFSSLPPLAVMTISSVFASTLTEFSSNVAVANVFLPVLAEMSKRAHLHPLYLMMPAALSCSHAFCLPVGTPPNAIAAAPCNLPTPEMVKSGLGVSLISMAVLLIVFPWLGQQIYQLDTFPDWVLQH